ncbi:MAG: hypothetical protein HZB42_03795 [Sphingobacteriales bacterium]|nr:hypothetical protein [Sphingobacteriales bacterium]
MAGTNTNSAGWQRFDFFLQQVQAIIAKAETETDPALSVYQQGIRTPLFMLEALCRIYMEVTGKKSFKKLRDLFKDFEDRLGAVDYYDGFGKEFSAKENIPQAIKDYIKSKMNEKLAELRTMLLDKGWAGSDNKRLRKIVSKLDNCSWPDNAKDAAAIKEFYRENIAEIVKDIKGKKINFDNVEQDVHELRREIRWLSIYPQALRGLMQLRPSTDNPEYLKKYLTPEILNSPFNKMPDPAGQKNIIYLDAGYFYALSWLIAELGKLKDNGLRIVAVNEALSSLKEKASEEKTLALCGDGQMSTADILKKSKEISDQFFAEKILQHLIPE